MPDTRRTKRIAVDDDTFEERFRIENFVPSIDGEFPIDEASNEPFLFGVDAGRNSYHFSYGPNSANASHGQSLGDVPNHFNLVDSNFSSNILQNRALTEPRVVTYACGMNGASKAKQGSGPGIASGTVAAPPEKMESVSKLNVASPLQHVSDISMNVPHNLPDDLMEEELRLKFDELSLRRKMLDFNKRKRELAGVHPSMTQSTATYQEPRGIPTQHSSIVESLERSLGSLVQGASLPKIELDFFDGSPKDFYMFIRNFESNVSDRVTDDGVKLSYLSQYCRGRAKEAIRHCMLMPKAMGFVEAIRILHQQFGRRYDIMQAVSREVFMGPKLTAGDCEGLRKLASQMKGCQTTLQQLNYCAELDCSTNLVKTVERLPWNLQNKWAEIAHRISLADREPNFGDLLRFVEERVAIASSQYGQLSSLRELKTANPGSMEFRHTRCNANVGITNPMSITLKCPLCEGTHDIPDCANFAQQSWEERRTTLKNNRRCFICLKSNHFAKTCRVQVRCMITGCGRRHHTLVHADQSGSAAKDAKVSLCGATSLGADSVCLGFVPVKLVGPRATITTYAFLDNGSDTTLIDERLAGDLGLQGDPCPMKFRTLSGTHVKSCSRVALELQSLDMMHSISANKVYTVSKLPLTQADVVQQATIERWSHLRDISIMPLDDKSVGILIGCDIPEAHWVLEQRLGSNKEPYAIRTVFGWSLRGPCHIKSSNHRTVNYVGAREASLDELVQGMYESEFVESSCSEVKGLSVEDKQALDKAEASVKLTEGHYELGLPWSQGFCKLPDNRIMAESRLASLKKRLDRDPNLKKKYSAKMLEHIRKGYVSKVVAGHASRTTRWFLPHHPVFNPNKPGKLRIVFDCAAEHRGTSLNRALLQGPDLNNSLLGVLLRFRKHLVAVSADIEEMFLQVRVAQSDRSALSLLWWESESLEGSPDIYEMRVHPFGATSSPFCASFALRRTASDNQQNFLPKTVVAVNENFYVDDCLMSFESIAEAKDVVDELRQMLQLGGFRLTKWVSNYKDVIQHLPVEDRLGSSVNLDFQGTDLQRALGVRWQIENDCFQFRVDLPTTACTKRGILKCVASLYDPLGIVSPMILPARKLLQDLCHQGAGWDASIDNRDQRRWETWLENVQSIESVELPRCVCHRLSSAIVVELHMFCDASEMGYGAAAYLRSVFSEGVIRCSFLMGKSRVTPQKAITIPRLELTAAVLSSKLMRLLLVELRIPFNKIVLWTDSTIVLRYIQNTSSRFATFVANRVKLIHDHTSVSQWRHVPSEQNPADVASRGASKASCKEMQLWLRGPEFLLSSEECWPKVPTLSPLMQGDPEIRRILAVAVESGNLILDRMVPRYSSWTRLLRAIAWISRFVSFVSKKYGSKNNSLSSEPIRVAELDAACLKLVKFVQEREFPKELKALGANIENRGKTGKLAKLRPSLIDGILYLGGRVGLRETSDARLVILPSRGTVTDLVIRHYHEAEGHMGASHVLACVRRQFWILKGMASVRRLIGMCYHCRKISATPCNQVMAPLPLMRVLADGHPFRYCGVDYFGPFKVKIGRSELKRYGCIFTCLQIRAIHLEIAHTMSTDSFLMALMRFVSRRGAPEVMYSDNGTNFVGADSELKRKLQALDQRVVSNRLVHRGIEWHFNPPGASHRGGVWERMIRTVRRVLTSVTQQQVLSEESLLTYMVEVERIINDRPLIPVYDDPENPSVLRPNDLLLLRSNVGLMTDNVTLYERYTKGWRQAQHLSCVFWKRWRSEYLPQLQTTPKWLESFRNLQVGDVVLLHGSASRGNWPYGVIAEVFPGRDGHVRQVVVKTSEGMLRRDIRSLCFMEASAE